MEENKWDGSLTGLVNSFLPQINISEKAKENCKNAIDELANKNQSNDENSTFKQYYNLCIKAELSSKEIFEKLKSFITSNINNGEYKIYEISKDVFEAYEKENLICRVWKISDQYYIPPNSIQIHGLYEG